MRRFDLDTNVFIEASQRYYPFDVCPGFWSALVSQHGEKRVFSIDRVKIEIDAGGDQLKRWANEVAPQALFKKTADHAVIDWFSKMVEWVQNEPQFSAAAKAEFAGIADGWVVAYAKTNGHVVVTQEVFRPDAKRNVPIPNLCREFNVEYLNTFDMLRELGIKLVLAKRS